MRILMLSDIDSIHSMNWANGLVDAGVDVALCGFYSRKDSLTRYKGGVTLYAASRKSGMWSKADFVSITPWVKKILDRVNPDIVHAHYASSYGLVARRLGFARTIVSVWGSDIYAFPNKGNIARNVLESNLNHAALVLSTSADMAERTRELTSTNVEVLPFGVDVEKFKPSESNSAHPVIGTVKALEHTYGIDRLIEVFANVHREVPDCKLRIVGEGAERASLEALARNLGVREEVSFLGRLPNHEIPTFLGQLDVFLALSRAESFGVSVVEAAACGIPALVSNVGGLPETVNAGETGYVMPMDDLSAVADQVVALLKDTEARAAMRKSAREFVLENYSREQCVQKLVGHYKKILGN